MNIGIIVIICMIMCLLVGCKKEDTISGGIIDHSDYNAPKSIESNDLIEFKTGLYQYEDGEHIFKMYKDNNTVVIQKDDKTSETDEEFVEKLQSIIKEYNLVEYNGINKKTAGLPPECGPYWISAKYASNEELNFSMNGMPDDEWVIKIYELFINGGE